MPEPCLTRLVPNKKTQGTNNVHDYVHDARVCRAGSINLDLGAKSASSPLLIGTVRSLCQTAVGVLILLIVAGLAGGGGPPAPLGTPA